MNEDLFDFLGRGSSFGGGGGGIFSSMFSGGMGGMGLPRRSRKAESTVQPLPVSLEDLYKGKTSKLQLTRKAICKACNGLGGKEGAVRKCDRCRGSGKVFVTRQIGPGMIQQMTSRCDGCHGEGEIINENDRCITCKGRKTVEEQKIIEVKITPGMKDNQKIIFYNEGDQEPDVEPSDVVFILRTKPHDTFKRKDDDLFIQKKISIYEALCGCTTVVKHLDGRELIISSKPGEVIQPDAVRAVIGEGMPKVNSMEKGNLYIVFDVEFPANHFTDENTLKKIEAALPRRPAVDIPKGDHVEEVSLSDYDPRRYERGTGGGSRDIYVEDESDEDMAGGGGGPQHVQCAQQ